MKIAIYARVSTADQKTIPQQIQDLSDYARLRNWNVVKTFEEKKSGASARRPEYSQLLHEARQRKFDGVLVWKIDRWGRNSRDIINSLHELDELGVTFISFKESLDLSTPHGRAMAQLIAVFANLERDLIGERVKAGVANAKKNGVEMGRPAKINEKLILKAKQLLENGYTYAKIMEELNLGRGTVYKILGKSSVKKGRPFKNEAQKFFTSSFKKIISNLEEKRNNTIQLVSEIHDGTGYLIDKCKKSQSKYKNTTLVEKIRSLSDKDKNIKIYLTVREIKPLIWREIIAPSSTTLDELHYYIQASFGWDAYHLYKFHFYNEDELEEDEITLMQLIENGNNGFCYEYDFGDQWFIDIKLMIPREQKKLLKPICIDGKRAGPPEDCGGVYGYAQLCRAMKSKSGQLYRQYKSEFGLFNPEKFSKAEANEHITQWLKALKKRD